MTQSSPSPCGSALRPSPGPSAAPEPLALNLYGTCVSSALKEQTELSHCVQTPRRHSQDPGGGRGGKRSAEVGPPLDMGGSESEPLCQLGRGRWSGDPRTLPEQALPGGSRMPGPPDSTVIPVTGTAHAHQRGFGGDESRDKGSATQMLIWLFQLQSTEEGRRIPRAFRNRRGSTAPHERGEGPRGCLICRLRTLSTIRKVVCSPEGFKAQRCLHRLVQRPWEQPASPAPVQQIASGLGVQPCTSEPACGAWLLDERVCFVLLPSNPGSLMSPYPYRPGAQMLLLRYLHNEKPILKRVRSLTAGN